VSSLIRSLATAISQHAGAIAVIDGVERHTYAELDRMSAEMAGGLRQHGIGVGDLICLYSTRTWLRCCALLGAWRVGAGVVSIEPGQPRSRAVRILRAVRPKLVLRAADVAPLRADISEKTYAELRSAAASGIVEGPISYVIATSGSSGEPKCVVLPPRVLAHLGKWHRDRWLVEALPDTLHIAPVGFDVGYEEIVATFLAGARLVLVDDDQRRDAFELIELIASHSITRVFQPVGGLHSLALAGISDQHSLSVREIVVAGEQLVINDEVRRFCSRHHINLVNEYGPSETHVVTQHRLTGNPWAWPDRPPIGTAIASAELLRFEGAEVRPFDTGERAELIVAGECVGLEYLIDQHLTEQKFREIRHQDGRLRNCYLTGDIVQWDGDAFTFLARADEQLKINGWRVEPSEIEVILGRVHGMRRVAVVGYRCGGSTKLAAYYVRQTCVPISKADIRAACARDLPSYMIPTQFCELSQLPTNGNGKINRAELIGLLER
jgi:non-ribosomal peptide synthetase component F